ncbi:MAG TPA: hypothetical protein ACFYEK_17070 [Candidatus Wunengus sp. YC60]|uniref:hypothetical protein n=1 Tax=Candidatus Wunengus sp. YC60 TaxID=3367697 RepID=UPI004029867F
MKIYLLGFLSLCVLCTCGCISEQIENQRNGIIIRIKELERKYLNLNEIIKEYEKINTDDHKKENRNEILTDLMELEDSYYKLKCNIYPKKAMKLKKSGTDNSASVQEILSEIKKTINDKSLFSIKKNKAYNEITEKLCIDKQKEIKHKMEEDIYNYTLEQGLIDIQDYYGLYTMFGDLLNTNNETE